MTDGKGVVVRLVKLEAELTQLHWDWRRSPPESRHQHSLGRQTVRARPLAAEAGSLRARRSEEQFWIVKHGIRMTGMPAWGITHSDGEIWNIMAVLQKLPKLSPAEYRAPVRQAGGHHGH